MTAQIIGVFIIKSFKSATWICESAKRANRTARDRPAQKGKLSGITQPWTCPSLPPFLLAIIIVLGMRGLFLISLKAKCREGSEKCWLMRSRSGCLSWHQHRAELCTGGFSQITLPGKGCYPAGPLNLHLEIPCAVQVHIAVGLGELIAFLMGLQLEIPI